MSSLGHILPRGSFDLVIQPSTFFTYSDQSSELGANSECYSFLEVFGVPSVKENVSL